MTPFPAAKTHLITGASRGIGRACAERLAAPGVILALCGRTLDGLSAVTQACRDKGAVVHPFAFDLADIPALEAQVTHVLETCGRLDVVVHNAGLWLEKPFLEGDLAQWDTVLDVNVRAVMHLTRHVLPHLPDGGAVVFLSSIAARKTYAGGTNYCATKFALAGFAGCLFEEVRERGIKVCSILPGVVNTDMHAQDASFEKHQMIQPEDVADTVAFVLQTPSQVCPTEIVLQPQRNPRRRPPL
jgi:NADP-dependent 3-hydroxy acid dehydrogenase YdfG